MADTELVCFFCSRSSIDGPLAYRNDRGATIAICNECETVDAGEGS